MKLFVWDFHGTLEKGCMESFPDVLNDALEKEGYTQRFNAETAKNYFGLPVREIFQRYIPDLSKEEIEILTERISTKESLEITRKTLRANDHAEYVLEAIANRGYDQILISNISDKEMFWFLEAVKLEKFFPPGKAFPIINGTTKKNKEGILKEYIETKKVQDIIIIGDSMTDIELAWVAGGVTYLYAHPGKSFVECKEGTIPDYRINDLREVFREI
ncbi:MAG: HAD hydrolase-like protein [bacterium]|nr:HAD hydrolase-like protein [bacterium]